MNIMDNVCKICSKRFSYKWGKKLTCSPECMTKWKTSSEYLIAWKEKVKATCIKKYGLAHSSMSPDIKEKIKQTNLKKYGVVSPTQNSEIRKKQISTSLERYGSRTPLENKNIFAQTKKTLKQNYGVDSPFKSNEIRLIARNSKIEIYGDSTYNNHEKAEKTNLEKYGKKHASQVDIFKEKRKRTCRKKYGRDYALQSQSVRAKIKKTNNKKYNADNPMQSESIKERQRQKRLQISYQELFYNKYQEYITPLFIKEEYIGADRVYKFKCNACNNEFDGSAENGGMPRCPVCFPKKSGTSKYEEELADFVTALLPTEKIERHNKTVMSGLELDIFIPTKKIAIEFDGIYWHSEIGGAKYKNYHLNKTKKCEASGITLIHIFEDEWLYKKDIIKNKLTYLLRQDNFVTLYARKCMIRQIDAKISNEFLDKVHLQGRDRASIRYGAYYNDELVAVMTFGKLRIALGHGSKADTYELYRYCSTKKIVGILSKFISKFISEYSPKKIITYADRRFSTTQTCGYSKCGFVFVSETPPNYWYLDKEYNIRMHRFGFRKSELKFKLKKYDQYLTEWKNMKENGYDRIWDCGHLKYEMTIPS